jgi:hypothetical protein
MTENENLLKDISEKNFDKEKYVKKFLNTYS